MKNLRRKIKKSAQRIMASFLMLTMVVWTLGASLVELMPIPKASAAFGYDIRYVDDGGSTPDVFLNDADTAELVLAIEAFESVDAASTNKITAVTLEIMDTTSPGSGEATGFTNADLTEVALYLDANGDNSLDAGDTSLGTSDPSASGIWTPLTSPTRWQYTFSGLNVTIPTSYSSDNENRILVTAKAALGSLDQTPLKGFHFQVPQNGIQVSVDSGASLTNFPSSINFFPPANLGTEGTGGYGSPIVISEIQTEGTTTEDEFIELYNRSPVAMDLNTEGLKLHIRDALGTDENKTLTFNNNSIPANGFFLITPASGFNGEVSADATYVASGNMLVDNGGAYISYSDTAETLIIDRVGWGTQPSAGCEGQAAIGPSADGSLERKAFPDSTEAKMVTGGIHASQGNGEDTDYNAGDFIVRTTADPQNSNPSNAEASDGGPGDAGSPVIINEVFYNTATGGGWIELYNRDTANPNQDIAGWKLSAGGNAYTLPTGNDATIMLSGGFITIHWDVAGVNDTISASSSTLYTGTGLADLGTYGGDVLLTLGNDTIKDYVQYGGSGFTSETPANNAGEWMLGDHVLNCLYGESIGRRSISGDDYNSSGDWQFYGATSPGNPNMGGDSTAPTKVTSVTLADGDSDNYGANGDDVTIGWTPSTISDPTFDRYELYLLLSTVPLDVDSHSPVDMIYGQYQYNTGGTQLETSAYTGGGFLSSDSAGGALDTGAYIAYIVAVDFAGNKSATAMSPAPTGNNLTADAGGTDTQKPFIMHMGVWQAKASADIVLVSGFDDDRELSTAQVIYKTGVTWQDPVNCAVVAINSVDTTYYTCTIPDTAAVENTEVSYYLKSTDATGNTAYMSASPENDMNASVTEGTIKDAPFIIDVLAADGDALGDYTDDGGAVDLSGNIYKSDGSVFANDERPRLFLEGTAIGVITPAVSTGLFEFPDNTLTPGAYYVVAFKNGYMDSYMSMFKGDTGLNIYLNEGSMNMTGGADGGYMEMPYVAWTSPMDGMMGAPTDIYCTGDCATIGAGEMPIIIAFSKEMNENTINDGDASNAGSNIYLTPDGGNTRIAGKVKYVYNASTGINEARFYSETHNTLTAGTFYSIVVTQNVTDINGASMQGGAMSDGSFSNSFNTMMDNSNIWGEGWTDYYQEGGDNYGEGGYTGGGGDYGGMDFSGYGGGGMMMPPYVMGTTPQPGAFGVDKNTSVVIEFSEPMNASGITADSIKLYPVSSETNWTMGTVVPAAVTLDQATRRIVTLNPTNNLDLNAGNSGWYVLKIMGSVKSASGIWLGDPGSCGAANPDTYLASQSFYESDFQLNSDADGDTGAPTVMGTYPSDDATGVDVGIAAIEIGFSEPMLPSTVNAQNITLKAGSSAVTGKVKYDPMANSAKYIPTNALLANTQYTLTISVSVQDLASVPFAAAHSISFRTGAADTTSPEILYANADDYSIAITFSEPMNTARQTDANRWTSSVLNSANYYVKGLNGATPVAPYAETIQLSAVPGGSFSFEYDEGSNTVIIEGFDFFYSEPHATDFQIYLDNVKDKSNNLISGDSSAAAGGYSTDISSGNATQGPVQNSMNTYGMLGPGGGGMMMMGPMGGGTGGGPGMDMGIMGMMGGGVFPMNMMAGQTSMYFVDVPLTSQIVSGGKIVLTFPSGFNVANAQQDIYSPVNKDFNEWADGTPTFDCDTSNYNCGRSGDGAISGDGAGDTATKGGLANDGVTVNTSARTVTINIHGDTLANDFLHLDLKGIVNSSIPKEFGTDGYTVDIKTMSSVGVLLENISTMPFYIQQGGANTISGDITAAGAGAGTMTVYLGSPMTGPMETISSAFSGGAATYSFDNLPDGSYHIFTDPFLTIDSTNYLGNMMPEPIWLSGGDATKDIILEEEGTTGAAITVTLTGNFATSGVADDVDIFANSPTGFRVKTVTPGNTPTGTNYTMYLPSGNWMIGIGPAMPKGPMAGPPTMPDWMSPMSVDIYSDGTSAGSVSFSIAGQTSTTVTGLVTDGVAVGGYSNGTPIADAEVFAYQPMGGFGGAYTKTATDGSFTLKIPVLGMYKVGAHKPGLPEGREMAVDVQNGGNYVDGTLTSSLIIKIKKPAYTISGKVLNADSKAVAYAPVWAYQASDWGHANTMTDASGNYILYVDNGTWIVEADAPGVGWMQYDLPVVVSGASQSSINIKPATDVSWYAISGTVTIDNNVQTYMPIRAVEYSSQGVYLGREYGGMTDSVGDYSISVPGAASGSKYYRVDIWTPDYGEVAANVNTDTIDGPANVEVSTANKADIDITVSQANLKTVTINFANKVGYSEREAFINIDGVSCDVNNCNAPTGFHKSIRVSDLSGSAPTVRLTAGNYFFFVDVPGTGHYMPTDNHESGAFNVEKGCIVVDGTGDTVLFTLPDLTAGMGAAVTIAGTVYAGSATPGNEVGDAWVWIGDPSSGFHTGTQTAADGTYSLTIPTDASYQMGADKPGYMSGEPVSADLTDTEGGADGAADNAQNFVLAAQTQTVSGKIYADISGGTADTYDSGEEIPNGWIYAEEISGGARSHAPVDSTGSYSLGVTNGEWKVYGAADGYSDTQYSIGGVPTTITVSGGSQPGKNIELTVDANWITKNKSKPITPASGGVIDDTAQDTVTKKASGTATKITVPPNALGSSNSSGNISTSETSAVSATSSHKPFAGKGKNITATDNSGQPITNLSDYIDMEMVLYKADIDAETDIKDFSKLKTMKVGYWDETLGEWISLPTTRTAYHKMTADTDWTMYSGTTTQTGFEKFIDDALVAATATLTAGEDGDYQDYKLVFKASTNHLSVFALGTSQDSMKPKAPTNIAQSVGNGTSVALTWDAVSENADDTAITDLFGYAVYRSDDSGATYPQVSAAAISVGTETYTDSTTDAWTVYYYKVTAGDDDNLESAYSSALQVCSSKDTAVTGGIVNAQTCLLTALDGYTCSDSTHTCTATSTGGGSPGGNSAPASTTGQAAVTSAAGGTVSKTNSDGSSAKVVFPAEAVSENATITVAPKTQASITASRPVPTSKSVVGNYIYQFTAVSGTTAANTFNKAVTITLKYTSAQMEGLNEGTLKIYYWDETTSAWVALDDSVVDAVNNTVTATTAHFTYFAILGTQTEEEETTTPETSTDILDGDIIQCASSSNPFAVYIVKVVGDTKYIRHIVSLDIFNYYTHLKWENLKQVDSLTNYSLSGWVRVNTGPNNTPGPTDKVYEVNGDQTKHWINMTAEQFLTHGGSDAAIYSVNQGELDLYTTGPDVMSL